MTRVGSLSGLLLATLATVCWSVEPTGSETAAITAPHWLWSSAPREPGDTVALEKSFNVPPGVQSARLSVMAEYCRATVLINGEPAGEVELYGDPLERDVVVSLRPGANEIAIRAVAGRGPAAVAARLVLRTGQGPRQIVSDPTWTSPAASVVSLGEVAARPWLVSREAIEINPLDDYTQWTRALGEAPDSEPGKFQTAPGFEVRLIRAAAPDEGSWVSLAVDPQGRFVIAREDKGLLRMTLDEGGESVAKVETINNDLLECRGLLFAHGSLYANANNSKGLYRLRDADGDDQFETVDLLYSSGGGVGHGRNDLALGPDGLIYSIHGDSVDLPRSQFDLTSPFREQRRGANTREGHVIRLNADGSKIELVAAGLRNPFGIDFNADGEMFTYDADAEHDMGAPWYRPTRVNQLVPGGDFGWRGVTGSWPPYFPDHPDNALPTLDIGKGSPTAVKFGRPSHFPGPYRDALYILDWAYGRVLAVHLVPRGAGYYGRAEPFLRGRPLNVTDLDFGPDGAMYLVTGGRKTQAALYRVRFTGARPTQAEPTAQQRARERFSAAARAERRALEALLTPTAGDAVERAWPWLASDDPQLVHAAQRAIEHQPLDRWTARTMAEPNLRAAVFAMLSLARSGAPEIQSAIVDRLNGIGWEDLSRRELQAAVYTYQLCLADPGLAAEQKRAAVAKVDALYPLDDFDSNRIMGEILVSQQAPSVVAKTLARFAGSQRQDEQMLGLHLLRNARQGWDSQSRRTYFAALRQSDDYLGGQGMPGFIQTIRKEAVATLSDDQRRQLGALVDAKPAGDDPATVPPRPLVQKWQLADLAGQATDDRLASRDLARGQRLFAAALCARCHRLGTQGRSVGPELTSVARRFSPRDLLKEILDPSATIAENYGRRRITTTAGKVYEGQVIHSGDYRSPVLKIATDPLAPMNLTEIPKAEIDTSEPSPQSFMPAGLLDTLDREEVLDLLAYIRGGGMIATNNPLKTD